MNALRFPFKIVGLFVLLLFLPGQASSAGRQYGISPLFGSNRDKGQNTAHVFRFPVQRGQYLFIGVDTGAKGKDPLEKGVMPLRALHVRSDAMAEKWQLEISVWTNEDNNLETGANWVEQLSATEPDGQLSLQSDGAWRDLPKDQAHIKKVGLEDVDESKKLHIEGLELHRIAYMEVDGEVHALIFGIAKSSDLFKKAITISPSLGTMFLNWDNWDEVPRSVGEKKK